MNGTIIAQSSGMCDNRNFFVSSTICIQDIKHNYCQGSCDSCECSTELSLPPITLTNLDRHRFYCEINYLDVRNNTKTVVTRKLPFPVDGFLTINGVLKSEINPDVLQENFLEKQLLDSELEEPVIFRVKGLFHLLFEM